MNSASIKTYVYSKLEVIREDSKGNIFTVCPFCGASDDKFSVNIEKGIYNCWRGSCGEKGTIQWLMKKLGASKYVAEYEIEEKPEDEVKAEICTEGYFQIWDQYFTDLSSFSLPCLQLQREVLDKKHTNLEELSRKGFKICTEHFEEEKDYGRCKGYLGIPFYDLTGKHVYFQLRLLPGEYSKIRYKFPKEIGEWKKTQFVWFSDPKCDTDFRTVTEAVFDANRIGPWGIGIGGSSLGAGQLRAILATNASRYYVITDSDTPLKDSGKIPGKIACEKISTMLKEYSLAKVYIPPDNYFGKGGDPDELSDSELSALYSSMREI